MMPRYSMYSGERLKSESGFDSRSDVVVVAEAAVTAVTNGKVFANEAKLWSLSQALTAIANFL